MRYYAGIYGNGRPTDEVVTEEYLDTANRIIMAQYVPIGEFEGIDEATDAYLTMTEPDNAGFYQWK